MCGLEFDHQMQNQYEAWHEEQRAVRDIMKEAACSWLGHPFCTSIMSFVAWFSAPRPASAACHLQSRPKAFMASGAPGGCFIWTSCGLAWRSMFLQWSFPHKVLVLAALRLKPLRICGMGTARKLPFWVVSIVPNENF